MAWKALAFLRGSVTQVAPLKYSKFPRALCEVELANPPNTAKLPELKHMFKLK
jgi:hypothetical protein